MYAIYVRVSTEEQAQHGASIEAQLEACRGRVPAGETVTEFVDAGASGATLDRPALQALRQAIRDGAVHHVVILDPDRLSRRLAHQLLLTDEWERHGVTLEFVNFTWQDTPEGRLFYSLRGAIAEFEREKIRERVQRGWITKAKQGRLVSGTQRYGYRYDPATRTLHEDPTTAPVVRQIFHWAAEDHLSSGQIAQKLAAAGVPAPRGAHWWRDTVAKLLRNPAYMGVAYVHRYDARDHRRRRNEDEWIPIAVPALVDEATWHRARQVMQHYQKFWKGRQELPMLLRRLVVCGRCHRPLSTNVRTTKRGEYMYYFCPWRYPRRYGGESWQACDLPWVVAPPVDDSVWAQVETLLNAPDDWERIGDVATPATAPPPVDEERELRRIDRARQRILRLLTQDLITEAEATRQLTRLREEAAAVRKAAATRAADAAALAERRRAVLRQVGHRLDQLTFSEKQQVVRELVQRVVIDVDAEGRVQVAVEFRG